MLLSLASPLLCCTQLSPSGGPTRCSPLSLDGDSSCAPNCTFWFSGEKIQVRVMERVLPGHELTVSYMHTLHLYLPHHTRRQRLKRTYGFDCACRCVERAFSAKDPH